MPGLSLTDLLLASLLPVLMTLVLWLAGRLLTGPGRRTPWPATGYAVARRVLAERGRGAVPVESLGSRADDHFDRGARCLRLRAQVFHGRTVWSAIAAAYASVWAAEVTRRRWLGALDVATAALVFFGGPAAAGCVLAGWVLRLRLVMLLGLLALYSLSLLDLAWLPARLAAAYRALATLVGTETAGLPGGTLRTACGHVLEESSRLIHPLLVRSRAWPG